MLELPFSKVELTFIGRSGSTHSAFYLCRATRVGLCCTPRQCACVIIKGRSSFTVMSVSCSNEHAKCPSIFHASRFNIKNNVTFCRYWRRIRQLSKTANQCNNNNSARVSKNTQRFCCSEHI